MNGTPKFTWILSLLIVIMLLGQNVSADDSTDLVRCDITAATTGMGWECTTPGADCSCIRNCEGICRTVLSHFSLWPGWWVWNCICKTGCRHPGGGKDLFDAPIEETPAFVSSTTWQSTTTPITAPGTYTFNLETTSPDPSYSNMGTVTLPDYWSSATHNISVLSGSFTVTLGTPDGGGISVVTLDDYSATGGSFPVPEIGLFSGTNTTTVDLTKLFDLTLNVNTGEFEGAYNTKLQNAIVLYADPTEAVSAVRGTVDMTTGVALFQSMASVDNPRYYGWAYWDGETDGQCRTLCDCDTGGEGECDEETAIVLQHFAAEVEQSDVVLEWITSAEPDNAGFHVWKTESGSGEYQKITQHLIPSEGSEFSGASYSLTDEDIQTGLAYSYKLEAVDINGISTFHGPVNVTVETIPPVFCGVTRTDGAALALALLALCAAMALKPRKEI